MSYQPPSPAALGAYAAAARPERRPSSALRVLSGIGLVSVLLGGLGIAFPASVPGGAALWISVFGVAGLALAGILLLPILIVGAVKGRFPLSLLLIPAVGVGALYVASAGIPERLRWPMVRDGLEQAEAAGECPAQAGLALVAECLDGDGWRVDDFGGGLVGDTGIAKVGAELAATANDEPAAIAASEGWHVVRDLGDGWAVVARVG